MEHLTDKELLNFAFENGMINLDTIQKQIEMNERKKYLEMHIYNVWKGNDGYWHTYLPDKEKGRVHKKRKTEDDLNKIIVDYWKKEDENPTIGEVFDQWNDRRLQLKKISPATHQRNKQIYKRHYSEMGNMKIRNIDADDFIDFLEEQIPQHNLTAKAFSNLKGITKGILKRAKKIGVISYNAEEVFYGLDTSETDFKRVIKEDYEEVFDENEMPKIMDYLISNLDTTNIAILLMFITGMRVGEVVALKHESFDGNTIKVRRTETRYLNDDGVYVYEIKEYPKSEAGIRTIVVPDDYLWIFPKIKALNPFGEYVFINTQNKRMNTHSVRSRLKKICKKLNIYNKSPHKIRKTYGTILLDNNVDTRLVIDQMGHADITCTEKHYHRNRKNIDTKSKVLSSIPEFSCM